MGYFFIYSYILEEKLCITFLHKNIQEGHVKECFIYVLHIKKTDKNIQLTFNHVT